MVLAERSITVLLAAFIAASTETIQALLYLGNGMITGCNCR
jgi:hypothetical protein